MARRVDYRHCFERPCQGGHLGHQQGRDITHYSLHGRGFRFLDRGNRLDAFGYGDLSIFWRNIIEYKDMVCERLAMRVPQVFQLLIQGPYVLLYC